MSSFTKPNPEFEPITDASYRPRRHLLPPGECTYCDRERDALLSAGKNPEAAFMPPHDASPCCKSGKHTHCSCDTCF